MSSRLIIIISVLFVVQIGILYWSYTESESVKAVLYKPFQPYLENPETVDSMDLSTIGIRELIPELALFENLEYLNLSDNRLSEIPEILFKLPKLKTLILSYNLIDEVDFINNSNIRYLDLSHNRITHSKTSGTFQNLKFINLSHNNLIKMPNFQSFELDTILISHNKLDSYRLVSNHIGGLIAHLDLANNNLEKSKVSPASLRAKCYSLILDNNLLKSSYNNNLISINGVPNYFFDYKSMLKNLSLRNCGISKVDNFLPYNETLESLDLSGNNLYGTINLNNSHKLKSFKLSNSVLSNLELKSNHLEELDISGIKVVTDDRGLEALSFDLPNLAYLKVDCSFLRAKNRAYKNRLIFPKLKQLNGYKCNEGMVTLLLYDFPNAKFFLEMN